MSKGMFLEVYATGQGGVSGVKIYLADDIYVVLTPENARKLSDAILDAVNTPTPPVCPDCGRPMTRREPWVCNNKDCGEDWGL